MLYSDYIFIGCGHVLAEESLMVDRVGEVAQRLARRHRTTVTITILAGEPVAPDECPVCGEIMPEIGMCWGCHFGEESDSIPFDGRAMEPKVITEADEYF